MGKTSYCITKQSATGVYGYELSHNQTVLFRNGNVLVPNPQPVFSTEVQTGRSLITYPIPDRDHPTIVPGAKVRYDIYDEEIKTNVYLEKVYQDFYHGSITVYRNYEALFKVCSQSMVAFISPNGEFIGSVENDLTFQYDSRSLDEARYIFEMDDYYQELLPYLFHTFILLMLGVL